MYIWIGSEMDEEDNRSDSGESSIDSWVNINVENDSANAILKWVIVLLFFLNKFYSNFVSAKSLLISLVKTDS
jgi:hypothetical protein